MKITQEFLKEKNACKKALEWGNHLVDKDSIEVLETLISSKKYEWANWLIVRVMSYKQYVRYAVYAAEQVIDIFEKKYPNDNRPRLAIGAAKRCIDNPSDKNAADAAAYAAWAAARAARAAADEMRLKILKYGVKLLEN